MKPIKPLEAEALEAEGLETEGLLKQEEEEEELGILQYLDQLEQVTARFLSRLVSLVTKNITVHVRSTCTHVHKASHSMEKYNPLSGDTYC